MYADGSHLVQVSKWWWHGEAGYDQRNEQKKMWFCTREEELNLDGSTDYVSIITEMEAECLGADIVGRETFIVETCTRYTSILSASVFSM